MKKPYSLNYDIERDIDRLQAVRDILDQLATDPSQNELEQMANYILYGKDENGKNAVQRKEATDSATRYSSFKRAADKVQSLDAILDNPLADQQTLQRLEEGERYIYTKPKPKIQRPKSAKDGTLLDPGDSLIPGMQDLWDSIDKLERWLAIQEGRLPAQEGDVLLDSYSTYKLRHQLIDVRRHQYYLKDAYNPPIHFTAIVQPKPQTYNWDRDSFYWMDVVEWRRRTQNALLHTIKRNVEDYEWRINPDTKRLEAKWIVRRHTFDWENPQHIRALIPYYSDIYMQCQEKLESWGRTLIYDFDRYQDMAQLSPVRQYILTRRIDRATYQEIADELQLQFGLDYNINHLTMIANKEIPEKIAEAAIKHRLLTDPTTPKKVCYTCKKELPIHPLFFGSNRSHKDGCSSSCKACERARRIAKGTQQKHDGRSKDIPKQGDKT